MKPFKLLLLIAFVCLPNATAFWFRWRKGPLFPEFKKKDDDNKKDRDDDSKPNDDKIEDCRGPKCYRSDDDDDDVDQTKSDSSCSVLSNSSATTLQNVFQSPKSSLPQFLTTDGAAIADLQPFLGLVRTFLPDDLNSNTTDQDLVATMVLQSDIVVVSNRQLQLADISAECLEAIVAFSIQAFSIILSFVGIKSSLTERIANRVIRELTVVNPQAMYRVYLKIEDALRATGGRSAALFAQGVIQVGLEAFSAFSITGIVKLIFDSNIGAIDLALIGVTLTAQLVAIFASGGAALTLRVLAIIGNASDVVGLLIAADTASEECFASSQPTAYPTIGPTMIPTTSTTNPPTPPTEDREDVMCPSTQRSGGQGITRFNVNVLGNTGSFPYQYQMYDIPDGLTIEYEGQTLFTTGGLVSGSASDRLTLPTGGTSTFVRVTVDAPESGTAWALFIGCVFETDPPTFAPVRQPTPSPVTASPINTTPPPVSKSPVPGPPTPTPPLTLTIGPQPMPISQAPLPSPVTRFPVVSPTTSSPVTVAPMVSPMASSTSTPMVAPVASSTSSPMAAPANSSTGTPSTQMAAPTASTTSAPMVAPTNPSMPMMTNPTNSENLLSGSQSIVPSNSPSETPSEGPTMV